MNNEQERRNTTTQNQDDATIRNNPQNISSRGERQDLANQETQRTSGQSRNLGTRQRYSDWDESSYSGESYAGLWAALIGLGAGIGAMYLLDPNRGARRRALIGDKFTSASARLPRAVRVTATDISNRAQGLWSEATKLFSSDDPSDQVLEARVRSKMGRVVSHPHSVHVKARGGQITLDGIILADEVPALLQCVEGVRGVEGVENRLQLHDSPRGIPSLQGGRTREQRSELMEENWSPAARFGAGAVGLGLSAVGATLIARSVSNTSMLSGRTAITIDKAINVNATPDVLFALWSNFENFPQFMSNVLEVRNTGENRSHWKVAGPAGVPVEWDAEITKVVPNELIAWKSVEGAMVPNAGYVLFEPNDNGTTEVTVRLSYNPPAGPIGHAVAKAFGADPKSEMDQDLMRMKSLLETGKLPNDASQSPINSSRAGRIH